MKPLVSVIIPSYNRGSIIGRTLESLQEQSHTHWECIIVDDGSTDDTCDVVAQYCKNDSRFRLYHRPSERLKGANACRNIGMVKSKGDYINFLDSDDTLHKDKFAIQIDAINHTPHVFSVCQTMVIDDVTNQKLGLRSPLIRSIKPLDDYISFKSFWTVHPTLFKSSFIKKFQFDEHLQQSQEYDLTISILASEPYFHTTETVLTYLHVHNQRMSSSVTNRVDKIKSNLDVRCKWLKKLHHQLLPETIDGLYAYIFDYYKRLVLEKEWYKALVVYTYLVKCSHYGFRSKRKRGFTLTRWLLAIPSYYLFNKGLKFLRFIK
jgi:glycosyltransferase involved in cell wall biosynthesis